MLRYNRFVMIGLVAALMLAAVAALVIFADPTPPAESAISRDQATVPSTPPGATTPRDMSAVNYIDRFGIVDAERWYISHGWDNGSWVENDWRREQVSASADGLVITLAPHAAGESKPYTSGEIQSMDTFRYGYFETRMRVPRGAGVVTGFFTFTRPSGQGTWQEIDMEIVGSNTRVLELAYHVGGRSRKQLIHLGFDASQNFNTYAFDWQSDFIRFYVNNQLVWEARGERVQQLRLPQKFIINLWNTEELHRWTGRVRPEEAPWHLHVACVAQARDYRGASLCAESGPVLTAD